MLRIFNFFSFKRIIFFIFFIIFIIFLFSGNSKNFATILDKANVLYAYDSGVTSYGTNSEAVLHDNAIQINENVWKWYDHKKNYNNEPNVFFLELLQEAESQHVVLPSTKYWEELDSLVLKTALNAKNKNKIPISEIDKLALTNVSVDDIKEALNNYGYLKFFSYRQNTNNDDNVFDTLETFNEYLRNKIGFENCPNKDFWQLYKQKMLFNLNQHNSFVNLKDGLYGSFTANHKKIFLGQKTWLDAYKIGLVEFLFIYPIDFCIEKIINNTNKDFGYLIVFIFLVLLMKLFFLKQSIKEDIDRQKKIVLQPKINSIVQKFSNISDEKIKKQYIEYEKRLLYDKYDIDTSFSGAIFQFFVFYIFFRAIQYSAIMSESFFNLYLNESVKNIIFNSNNLFFFLNHLNNQNGFLAAILMLLFNVIIQIMFFRLPIYIRNKYYNKIGFIINNKDEKNNNYIIIIVLLILFTLTMPISISLFLSLRLLFSVVQMLFIYYLYRDKIIERCTNE